MSPRIQRAVPAYLQVTDHFRKLIQDGTLAEGDKLPTVADVSREWGVAHATAAKALGQLQVEGLVLTSPRGTFVAGQGATATSPSERLARFRRTGSLDAAGEHHRVTSAEVIKAPTYVAELFGLEPGEQVLRREWTTVREKQLMALTVTWNRADLAERVPDLLTTAQSVVGRRLALIEPVTGAVTHGRDFSHARGGDAREGNALGIPTGAALLAVTWLWVTAADGGEPRLVEYGESCLPPRHTLTYDYESGGMDEGIGQ
jgi:GntR family transcriptional regulator